MIKLKSFGLDWMVVRSEGDYYAIYPKVNKYLWLYWFLLYKPSRRKKIETKELSHLFLLPITPHHLHLLLQSFSLLKFSAAPHFFLLLRFVSWVSTLVLHVLLRKLGWWTCDIWDITFFSWIHVHLCLIGMN